MRAARPLFLLAALILALAAPGAARAQSATCPCNVFGPADAPLGDALEDSPVEVGMKFRSDADGFITALRFYKQANNTGTHVGHLWTSTGQQLAEVPFTSETATGWQEAILPVPVAIQKDTTYITSYHSSQGRFGFNPTYFVNGIDRAPLHAPSDGLAGGNGVYRYGASAFPNETWNATNYWVDVTFEQESPVDTRAPLVTSTSPAQGATGVPPSANVTADFDEALEPTTVNAGAFTLTDDTGATVVANVTWDAANKRATLDPQSSLALGKTYTATLKSGTAGVTDLAGNRLAADRTWTFSTASACPCTVFGANDAPTGDAVTDQPVEVGMKFRSDEDGFITALRFYKQANNTGAHVGHLWSATGQLLATAPYTNETASGWQQVDLPNPVPVTKDTVYVTSYYAASGRYAFSPGFFNQGLDRPPLHAPASTPASGNGVFRYGASGFPDQSFNGTSYWVDASFDRTIPPDTRGPVIASQTPAAGATDVSATTEVSATFDEQLAAASVSGSTFTLRDEDGDLVPADVSYDAGSRTAKLKPQSALSNSETYLVRIKGGTGGVTDAVGNPLTVDRTWTFTTEAQSPGVGPGGPIAVITDPGDPFGRYYAEILRGEGLNEFSVDDGPVTAAKLSGHDTVVLAQTALTDTEAALLTTWVQGGGNLIAMRPDKKLGALLGLTDANATRANQYLKVDQGSAVATGIYGDTMQFHGTADRYSLSGASAIASLYSDAATATSDPAVTLRDVGTNGGQAVAFTYDLARSVVMTRQGNPAWAGQKRDGTPNGIRADDLFYPDWIDMSKVDVPQADEQQRLLANLITEINRDKAPLPRFWYLPRGEKAAVVETGDDHAKGGTPAFFDRMKSSSPAGCSVADWECVRGTSYVYPDTQMTDAQVAGYQADGFEVALHLVTGSGCQDFTPESLEDDLSSQLARFTAAWPSADKPVTNRTHCIVWSDWATEPKLEKAHGIRFDTNYYYKGPEGWLPRPGLLTGGGFPQRFADSNGALIDVYQAMTQVTDESELPMPRQVDTLLDNALGSKAFYGVVTVLNHSDNGDHANLNDIVASAQDRGVPIVSSEQMLDWLDGRNASSFEDVAYAGGRLTFSVVTNPKARGIEAMLPAQSGSGPLSGLTRGGAPVAHEKRTIKGVEYYAFKAAAGDYTATYANDASAPAISQVQATADADGHATVTWETDEPATSRVDYGRTTSLGSRSEDTARVTRHSVELTGLSPNTTYRYRVTSADAAGNSAASPAAGTSSFATPPGALVDDRASEFRSGAQSSTYAGQTVAGADGEVQLQPAVGEEFEGAALPSGWNVLSWGPGGSAVTSGGSLVTNGASTYGPTLYEGPRVIEFSATFRPVNDQAVGFGNDLSDAPYAVFGTGAAGSAFQMYAQSAGDPGTEQTTPLPGVSLNTPHRFRVEWNASNVRFFVDGGLVATHTGTITRLMRPAASDYGLFGAGVQVNWLRQGGYAASGTFTSRTLDSGPGANQWQTLTAQTDLPSGTQIAYDTRSGSTREPDAGWSAWAPVGASGAIASPAARYIQYRARMASSTGIATPTLGRVQVSFGAGTDRAPVPGTVTVAPASPRTGQTVTATPSGFSDPDGDPLTYHYRWLKNGTPIPGATTASLDLSQPGNGDHGDEIRAEVYATDGRGAASDPAFADVTVANTAPTAGSVTVKPTAPATNDVVKAVPAGYADADGDQLTYRYQWLRNGTPISGATAATLDLAVAGNGDNGDTIAVDVTAVDSGGGTSPAARGSQAITGTNATPVEGTASIAPVAPKTNDLLTASQAGFRDPDGDALTYRYRWLRNGTAIAGATASTLDLAQPGNGDRGDVIRLEVTASDPGGRTSDASVATATVANTAPTAGTVSVKPNAPSSDDIASAAPAGFADADSDAVTFTYQWFRNGTAISGATGRTLDLSEPGNGDAGDTIAVDVRALDGSGGSSATVRGSQTIGAGLSHPVASYGFEEATGTAIADESGSSDGGIGEATRTNLGRFGRALSFDGEDDKATVPDNPPLDLATSMTVEAWVKPRSATDWRTVLFKESGAGVDYALYASSDTDVPSVNLGGDPGARGSSDLDPGKWSHLAATYDNNILRLFVNGTQVGTRTLPEALDGSFGGPLSFGGNYVWGEHFDGLIDEVRIYNRALTTTEIGTDMDQPVVPGTPAPPADPGPDQIGSFAAPRTWPIVPVHMALTSNGQVASWDGFEAALDSETLWNPATDSFLGIPTGRNLFCAGQVTIGDGRLAVFGGHINAYEGTKDTNLYNPQTGTWERGADMSVARWYPTTTALPDGRVFVISGDGVTLKEPGQSVPLTDASNTLPSIYDPKTDSWTDLPQASRRIPLYPFIFVLPNGKLFDAGPDTTTRTFDLDTKQWTTVGTSPVDGQSAVMYRPGKIMKSGTWSDPEFPGRAVTNRAAAIDMTGANPSWREIAPMNYKRAYHTLTVLPDGKVLATGGENGTDGVDETKGVLGTEIWDPDTDTWTPTAFHRRPRLYHSSALLLPDGRVLLAGGGAFGNAKNEKSSEIYSPPYLFKGARPTISAAPATLNYGSQFTVDTPDAAQIGSVSLVRMGSVTHNIDMDQRFIPLAKQNQSGSVRVDGPANANIAPPGYYMVFIVNSAGVPSVGKIVKVEKAADTTAPTAPGGLTAAAQTGGNVKLDWTASTDAEGVTEYRVHRSTTAGFTPSAANRVATVASGTTFTDPGLANGTYYYRVIAADAAGNASQPSNQANVTVNTDATPPTVSLTAPAANALVRGTVNVTANAADNVGVQSVQFRVDGNNVGSADTTSPYALSLDTSTLTNGSHQLSAVARDAAGNTTTSANVSVTIDNAAPAVSVTAPAAGAHLAGTVSLTASASDNVAVQDVQLRVDGNNVGSADTSSPYTASLNTTTLSNGSHTLTAVARDTAGNSTTSASVAVVVDNQAPGAPATLSATGQSSSAVLDWAAATDNVAVSEYRVHRSTTSGFTASAANRVATVTSGTTYTDSPLTPGTYYYRVIAADEAGNAGAASPQASAVVENTAPNVSVTAPAAGSLVRGTVNVTATASDNVGVQSVQFRVDGNNVGSADTTSPYALSLDTTTLSNGSHQLSAVARDAAGNTRTSSNVAITVDNAQPTVAITQPANNATISGTTAVTATASDNVAVQSVAFQVDGATVATDTSAPYTLSAETSWLNDGSHTISAVATDTAGNTRTATISVTVDNNAPTVSISSPAAGATVSGTTTVTATAADTVGVQNVQFRVDGANVGSADTSSPYQYSWNTTALTDGEHTLSAIARDAAGNTRTSANVTVTVDNDGLISAFGFEETSGSTVTDLVRDHDGTISGATRTTSGRFGRALQFDGANDWVTIPNDADFNLTSGLTIEAWVRPDILGSTWRTVVMKERASNFAYALFANNNTSDPAARIFTSSDLSTNPNGQLPLNTWSHLAMTWASNTLRLYVNGTQVASRTTSGSLTTGTGPLRIGGNSFRSEWFDGRIDEVRVYRRALPASEIAADMNRAAP
jgi:hypothetical protein